MGFVFYMQKMDACYEVSFISVVSLSLSIKHTIFEEVMYVLAEVFTTWKGSFFVWFAENQ